MSSRERWKYFIDSCPIFSEIRKDSRLLAKAIHLFMDKLECPVQETCPVTPEIMFAWLLACADKPQSLYEFVRNTHGFNKAMKNIENIHSQKIREIITELDIRDRNNITAIMLADAEMLCGVLHVVPDKECLRFMLASLQADFKNKDQAHAHNPYDIPVKHAMETEYHRRPASMGMWYYPGMEFEEFVYKCEFFKNVHQTLSNGQSKKKNAEKYYRWNSNCINLLIHFFHGILTEICEVDAPTMRQWACRCQKKPLNLQEFMRGHSQTRVLLRKIKNTQLAKAADFVNRMKPPCSAVELVEELNKNHLLSYKIVFMPDKKCRDILARALLLGKLLKILQYLKGMAAKTGKF